MQDQLDSKQEPSSVQELGDHPLAWHQEIAYVQLHLRWDGQSYPHRPQLVGNVVPLDQSLHAPSHAKHPSSVPRV